MLNKITGLMAVVAMLSLAGCALPQGGDKHINPDYVKVEVPYVLNNIEQVKLIRLARMLNLEDASNREKAELLYARAVVYDRLGLSLIAQLSLMTALELDNQLPYIYAYLADLYISDNKFQEAYEAYDAALELAPNDEIVGYRGMGLLYGNRLVMAKEDLLTYYNAKPQDPHRMLWLYMVEASAKDPKAIDNLSKRRGTIEATKENDWVFGIIDVITNKVSEDKFWGSVLNNKEGLARPETLCESYYYLGKYHQLQGKEQLAQDYFKLAMMTNVVGFIEYRYALKEIARYEMRNKTIIHDISNEAEE